MSETEVDISCPHCRREYHLRLDLDKLTRVRTRAVCSRCRKSFDIGSRVPALAGKIKTNNDVVEIYAPAEAEPERTLPGTIAEPRVKFAKTTTDAEVLEAAAVTSDLTTAPTPPRPVKERPEPKLPANDSWLKVANSGLGGLTVAPCHALEKLLGIETVANTDPLAN